MSRAFLWGALKAQPKPTAFFAERLCREAEERRKAAAARHFWKTLDILERAGRLWAKPSSVYRRRAQSVMPRISGFSPAMVRETLEIIPRLLDRTSLRARLAAELGREDALDVWGLKPSRSSVVKAFPLGSVLHVAAGNIFLGCIDSVLMSLLTNNVTILRLSSADPVFPLLFAESLAAADRDRELVSGLAIVSWDKELAEVEAVFKSRLQGIVVWGGEAAVSAYRKGLSPGCRLIAFGPKLSFGVITREGLRRHGPEEAARRAARDIVWWDQAACASPQTLLVQDPRPDAFLDRLASELARQARALPLGSATPDEAAATREGRERAEAHELDGSGRLSASRDFSWTVAWEPRGGLKASPLRRFIRVCAFKDIADLAGLARPSAAYLQSAGLLAAPGETAVFAEALAAAGATRIPELGRMLESETGEPHDGRYPLGELVRWVSAPAQALGANAAKAEAAAREQAAAESPFYRRRARARLLDKDDLYRHAPPRSEAILTRAAEGQGRLIFASGGSTGKPKFSLYTQDEFEETCRWLAWGLTRSGLAPKDVVANLFVAGNLWSSFMAVSQAARALEVTHLPIAGTSEPAFILETLARFKANVLIGLPSTLLDLARKAEARKRRIRVDKIFYGGEHASEEMRRAWTRTFGARLIRSAGYASVDAGLIGFQCAHCEGGVHHAAGGLQKVEIVGGEITATNLVRRWMPILRYRTGDRGRWIQKPCPCGEPAPLFELLGRIDDRVNVGGAHLDVGDVGRAAASVPGLSLFYQVVVSKGEKVLVKVERKAAVERRGLAERLASALLRSSEELRDSVGRGWLAEPSVEILPPGGLPRQTRTGKIRRVVDLRR